MDNSISVNSKNNNRAGIGFSGISECQELLRRLQQLDFVITDANLYADVYPDCIAASEYLAARREERTALIAEYEAKCGLLTIYGIGIPGNGPWPWEYAAN